MRKATKALTHEIIVGYVRIAIWCEATYGRPQFRFEVTRLSPEEIDRLPEAVRRPLAGTWAHDSRVESAREDRDGCNEFGDNDFTDLMRASALADSWVRAFARVHQELGTLSQPDRAHVAEAAADCISK